MSGIAQRLGTNYETALRHLSLLEKEGVVTQRASGKTRFFPIRKHSEGASCNEAVGRVVTNARGMKSLRKDF